MTNPLDPASAASSAPADRRYRPDTGCAAMALQRGDSLIATAPPADRWLLIESRTPWPRHALNALPDVGVEVASRCAELGYRPVLIRRHGRPVHAVVRRYALVDCRPGHESTRWGEFDLDADLLSVLNAVATNTLTDLEPPTQEPIYLVCTHGRHDACCAVRGRPVAAALTAAYPDRTWECSHIGGDRFAGNVVVLPHALFYGQVTPARAVEVAKHHAEGRVVPDLLRGAGTFPPPVQAAQHYARQAGHSLNLNTLHPTHIHPLPNHHYKVTLTTTPQPTEEPTAGSGEHPANVTEPTAGMGERPAGVVGSTAGMAERPADVEEATAGMTGRPAEVEEPTAGMGGRPGGLGQLVVEVSVHFDTVDARLTCAGQSPVQVRRFELHGIESVGG